MKTVTLSVLVFAAAAIALPASAQDAGYQMPPAPLNSSEQARSGDAVGWHGTRDMTTGLTSGPRIEAAFDALKTENFARAEEVFAKVVRRNPRDAAANFYLGATRMDLGKWEDAKKNLEIAARKIRSHPDPKSRLGVTYAKLGDTNGAHAQRAALVKMAESCKQTCRLAPYITDGIRMIDEALAEPQG